MPDLVEVLVFGAAAALAIGVGFSRPAQWGSRRLAFGGAGVLAACAGGLGSPSPWWFAVAVWALQQVYVGWGFSARRRRAAHERIEYLESSAAVLAWIALADGQIDGTERVHIEEAYRRAGCTGDEQTVVGEVVSQCERAFRADACDTNRLFQRLRTACDALLKHSNSVIREEFVHSALLIISSDGYVSALEEELVTAATTWLGIPRERLETMWRESRAPRNDGTSEQSRGGTTSDEQESSGPTAPTVPPDLATYYARILGVEVTASPDEVKRAYRNKAKQYHPDMVAHRGPAFAAAAEEQFKELSRAYEFFRGVVVS